jgi:hypothetical protein
MTSEKKSEDLRMSKAWAKIPRSLPGNVFLASSQENREGF